MRHTSPNACAWCLEPLIVKFSEHNLFLTPKVPVTLKHLPGVTGGDAVDEGFLQSLVDCPHDGIFETEAAQAMVLAAWQQYRVHTLLEIVSCLLKVLCLRCTSYGFRHGFAFATPCLYVVAVLHVKRILDFVHKSRSHFDRPYYLDEFEGRWLSCCSLGFIHSNVRSLGSLGWQLLQHFLGSGSCTACVAKLGWDPDCSPVFQPSKTPLPSSC